MCGECNVCAGIGLNPCEPTKLQVVCFYCHEVIGEIDGKGETGITHGICPNCFEKAKKEIFEGEK